MQRKNRLIWNFLLAYLTVSIPMLLVSFLVSGQTIRRMEENSYHAIQDRVNRASKDFVTLLSRYRGKQRGAFAGGSAYWGVLDAEYQAL